jgi:hypothetical protein
MKKRLGYNLEQDKGLAKKSFDERIPTIIMFVSFQEKFQWHVAKTSTNKK